VRLNAWALAGPLAPMPVTPPESGCGLSGLLRSLADVTTPAQQLRQLRVIGGFRQASSRVKYLSVRLAAISWA
jgi:hypothetical protein